jgi:hypothetical protein
LAIATPCRLASYYSYSSAANTVNAV